MINNLCSTYRNETNTRIYERNIPPSTLQPYLDVRPASTKYSLLPIVEPRKSIQTPFNQLPTYSTLNQFNPGNKPSPWSGYSYNITIESELRNQYFANQKCSQAVYVPNSNSDLYINNINHTNHKNTNEEPFPYLFQQDNFNNFNPNPENIAQQLFLNDTRIETRSYLDKNVCLSK